VKNIIDKSFFAVLH